MEVYKGRRSKCFRILDLSNGCIEESTSRLLVFRERAPPSSSVVKYEILGTGFTPRCISFHLILIRLKLNLCRPYATDKIIKLSFNCYLKCGWNMAPVVIIYEFRSGKAKAWNTNVYFLRSCFIYRAIQKKLCRIFTVFSYWFVSPPLSNRPTHACRPQLICHNSTMCCIDFIILEYHFNNYWIITHIAVPLHAMEELGGRGGIAPTHSRPRH
jgi:hypothetical protein